MDSTTSIDNSTLMEIAISNIIVGDNNPRKNFDESSLAELSQSIASKGVLQPILLRPVADGLELVCGERRLRASILAGIQTIPALIREMSDDEAFEAMIVENLERKDVHPMEEAQAFQRMLDTNRYNVTEIAAKFAKHEMFVIHRLKLNSLIDSIKEDFFNDIITIGQAVVIARQTEANQNHIFENYKDSWNASHNGYGTMKQLNSYVDGFMTDLSEVLFDKERTDLNSACISCTLCPQRTGANALLFSDLEESDNCLDKTCLDEKTENHFKERIQELANSEEEFYFIDWGTTLPDFVVEICQELQIRVLKENKDYKTYNSNDIEKKKAIRLDNYGLLKETGIYLVGNLAKAMDSTEGSFPNPNLEKIENIKTRAKRGLELDQEKITKSISDSFADAIIDENINHFTFDADFMQTVFMRFAFECVGIYQINRWLIELDLDKNLLDVKTVEELQINIMGLTFEQKSKLLCKMIYSQYKNYMPGNIGTNILRKAFTFNPSNNIAEIERNQQEKADKRIARETERIAELSENVQEEQTQSQDEQMFVKVPKKYALNNSYFKNRRQDSPATVLEIAQYKKEHGELPFEYNGENWTYDAYIEYQKRNGVSHSQYFTPDATAKRMVEIAEEYFDKESPVLDACCGFGQLSKALHNDGYTVESFDFSNEMVSLYNEVNCPMTAELKSINEVTGEYWNIISNPPYEVPAMMEMFTMLEQSMTEHSRAILLLPKGFMEKTKPKKLLSSLSKFDILHSEVMNEAFVHTNIQAEIVVLVKV